MNASEIANLLPGNKIQAIKALRAVTSLGLKEAKDVIDAADRCFTLREAARVVQAAIDGPAEVAVSTLTALSVRGAIVLTVDVKDNTVRLFGQDGRDIEFPIYLAESLAKVLDGLKVQV